jgi:hypothetical protein
MAQPPRSFRLSTRSMSRARPEVPEAISTSAETSALADNPFAVDYSAPSKASEAPKAPQVCLTLRSICTCAMAHHSCLSGRNTVSL